MNLIERQCLITLATFSESSSSDDDNVIIAVTNSIVNTHQPSRNWIGRVRGSRGNITRGACSWHRDYLCNDHIYPPSHFRRRFRVPLSLYRRLERDLMNVEPQLR